MPAGFGHRPSGALLNTIANVAAALPRTIQYRTRFQLSLVIDSAVREDLRPFVRQSGGSVRSDIEDAFNALDAKGQATINGLRVGRQIRKGFEALEVFFPETRILALATGSDPGPSMSEQRSMGAASSFGAISSAAKSGRLLVLTEFDMWEVRATGRLNGSRPEGMRLGLQDIIDVRTRVNRGLGSLGAKERILSIDYTHGPQVETRVHVVGSDSGLEVFATRLIAAVNAVAELEAAEARLAVAPVPVSVADELAKLVQLRDSGVLTPDEFAQQKAKLL